MPESRVAIITGSADGIGKAIALRLATDGCDIVVNDLPHQAEKLKSVIREIEIMGRRATSFIGDVSLDEDVQDLVEHAVTAFGSLDIMVANAGVFSPKQLIDITCEDFDRVMSINLRGVFLSYKYAAIQMIKQGRGGKIIGASSSAGKRALEYTSSYSASKFGVRGLTQSAGAFPAAVYPYYCRMSNSEVCNPLAQEWGSHGITVNTYCPGFIMSPMTIAQSLVSPEKPEDDVHNKWAAKAATCPIGKPQDIANLVSFLASKESSFITGQSITADGGVIMD